jgi:hypothetical protein
MVAENLISYLLDYQESESVAGVIDHMGEILTTFEKMDCVYAETQVKQTGQSLVLNGGTKCVLTQEVFSEMKIIITRLRNDYTK